MATYQFQLASRVENFDTDYIRTKLLRNDGIPDADNDVDIRPGAFAAVLTAMFEVVSEGTLAKALSDIDENTLEKLENGIAQVRMAQAGDEIMASLRKG